MFTVCIAVFWGLTATVPESHDCFKLNAADTTMIVGLCKEKDRTDPLGMCEARRAGALKWYITSRDMKADGT